MRGQFAVVTHKHKQTHKHTNKHTNKQTHKQTNTQTHTHTQTQTHTLSHTHTHTHTHHDHNCIHCLSPSMEYSLILIEIIDTKIPFLYRQ
jgi:hypothetical protein